MYKKRLGPVLGVLGMLLAASAPAVAGLERVETTIAHEGMVARDGSLSLENLLGSISVRGGGPEGKVLLEARVVAEAKTMEEARTLAEAIEVHRSREGNGLRFHVSFPVESYTAFQLPKAGQGKLSRWLGPLLRKDGVASVYEGRPVRLGRSKDAVALAVHLTVTIPNDIRSSIRQYMGSLECTLIKGRVKLENVEGNIEAKRIYGMLEARTGGGDLKVLSAKGDQVVLQTGSGDLEMIDVHVDEAHVRTLSGRIKGKAINVGNLIIDGSAGNVDLEEMDTRKFKVAMVSGDVTLSPRLQRTREGSILSASGNVTLRVGNLAPFDLRVRSESGSVKTKGIALEVSPEGLSSTRLSRGTGGADLRITTGSGEVLLRTR